MKFPYERVYFTAGSIWSIRKVEMHISAHLNLFGKILTFGKKTVSNKVPVPTGDAYDSMRICDGKLTPDYLAELMPEMPYDVANIMAYPGASSFTNYLEYFIPFEGAPENTNIFYKPFVSKFSIAKLQSYEDQCQNLIKKELDDQKSKPGEVLHISWGGGGHNDIIGFPYLAGYKKRWDRLPKSVFMNELHLLQDAYDDLTDRSTKAYADQMVEQYKRAGIKNFVILKIGAINDCPMFYDLKRKQNNQNLTDFIDGMPSIYDQKLSVHLERLSAEYPDLNITYLDSPDIEYDMDYHGICWLDEKEQRNGKPFSLKSMTEQDKEELEKYIYYDDKHLTSSAQRILSHYLADTLKQSEKNIKAFYKQQSQTAAQEAMV